MRHKHTHYPGPGRRDDNVVGERLWPTYAAKALALLFLTAAVVFLLGGLAQINPIWIYGPFRAGRRQRGVAARLVHGLARRRAAHHAAVGDPRLRLRDTEPVLPRRAAAGVFFTLLYLAPFIEARFTKDHAEHHVLDRPRDRPLRTAIGVGVLAFYLVLLGAASGDVLVDALRAVGQHRDLDVPHRRHRRAAGCVRPHQTAVHRTAAPRNGRWRRHPRATRLMPSGH